MSSVRRQEEPRSPPQVSLLGVEPARSMDRNHRNYVVKTPLKNDQELCAKHRAGLNPETLKCVYGNGVEVAGWKPP